MVIECRNLIRKPSGISLPAEMVPLEQWCMNVMTVATCILSTVAVATAIVPIVSMIKQINGMIADEKTAADPLLFVDDYTPSRSSGYCKISPETALWRPVFMHQSSPEKACTRYTVYRI
jgi:hypothetical protein